MTTKICKSCNCCKRLYRILGCGFTEFRLLYCTEREEIISEDFCCGKWSRKRREYDLSPQRFDEVENDIKIVYEYLKD